MVKVIIKCPICNKVGRIELPEEFLVDTEKRGLVTLNLGKDQICQHSFIAYIDNNYVVRDCFFADFQIELPQLEVSHSLYENQVPDSDVIDVKLINLNLHPLTLAYIIRSVLLKKKILLLSQDEFIHSHLRNFFNIIFKDSFEIDLSIEKSEVYKNNKKDYKDYVIFEDNKVVQDKRKILNNKKVKIEKIFVQKFLLEYNSKIAIIFLRNEIQKAYELANELSTKINELLKNNQTDVKHLFDNLSETYKIKLSLPYLSFLIEIIENYFDVKIPDVCKFFLFRL